MILVTSNLYFQELYPNLNAIVLNKHLKNLHDEALLEYFQEFCINAVATFDAREEHRISQMANIVDSLSIFSTADVQARLEASMMKYVEKVIVGCAESNVAWTVKVPTDQLQYLSNSLQSFCIATLKIVSDKFGNFGLVTWCPLLAKICLKVGLNRYDVIKVAHESEHYGSTNRPGEFYENSFLVFTQVKF